MPSLKQTTDIVTLNLKSGPSNSPTTLIPTQSPGCFLGCPLRPKPSFVTDT